MVLALKIEKNTTSSDKNIFVKDNIVIKLDHSRDNLLTDFGKATLDDRYLLEGENYQTMFARVAVAYSDNQAHAQRVYDAISRLWFMPATPVLSNGGTDRGLPISCYLNEVEDSLDGIKSTWFENVDLAAKGGGIGTYWGNVRGSEEAIRKNGKSSGIIPFIGVTDRLTLAISQGSLRRGSAASYLPVNHPEIEEFIEIRRASGDINRKALNLHHAVIITDDFMEAVEKEAMDGERATPSWNLISPADGSIRRTISAMELWQKILTTRLETGEPYMIFKDTANQHFSPFQKKLGMETKTSNLCSEIFLHTGKDHLDNERTAVCCLSSLNIEKYYEWRNEEGFIEDVMRFLDNVLDDYIERAPQSMANAKYSAMRERSVGLGVMGFHAFLQQNNLHYGSPIARSWNNKIFKYIKQSVDQASHTLAIEKGPCPDAADAGVMERFAHKMAVAPTASISIICGTTSPSIEPWAANIYTQKTLSGSFSVRNPYLKNLLASKSQDHEHIWMSILENEGSVQHLDFLTDDEKEIFKTAFEIDQRNLIRLAADRTPYICQGQSLNIFLNTDIHKFELHMMHYLAWKWGVKSLYYCRSKSLVRAGYAGGVEKDNKIEKDAFIIDVAAADECLACQ